MHDCCLPAAACELPRRHAPVHVPSEGVWRQLCHKITQDACCVCWVAHGGRFPCRSPFVTSTDADAISLKQSLKANTFPGPVFEGRLHLFPQGAPSFIRCVPGLCCWLLPQRAGMHPEASDTQDAAGAACFPDPQSWRCEGELLEGCKPCCLQMRCLTQLQCPTALSYADSADL